MSGIEVAVGVVVVLLGAVVAFIMGFRVEERRQRKRETRTRQVWASDVVPAFVGPYGFKGVHTVLSEPKPAAEVPVLRLVHHRSLAVDPAKEDVERVVYENFLLAQAHHVVAKFYAEFVARGFRVEDFELEVDEKATVGALHIRFSKLPKRGVP